MAKRKKSKHQQAAPAPTRAFTEAADAGADLARASAPAREALPLVASFDLDADDHGDVAPIGPTEPREHWEPTEAAEAPLAQDAPGDPAEIAAQIRELEARLDRLIRDSTAAAPEAEEAARVDATADATAEDDADPASVVPSARSAGDTADELTSTQFYVRQWGRLGMRSRGEEVDDFGLDPKYEARLRPMLDFLYSKYFRAVTEGAHHIPNDGPCLVVANHSGGPLPYDGIMLRAAVRREHEAHRELRWLAEDFIYFLPFVGAMMSRIGAVRACQENAERLLSRGRLVAVFPEGAKGIGKLYKERYRLQRFGRGGFIRLCLRMGAPLVPCAIVGAEEANPMLYRIEHMMKSFGMPYFPVTPTFPLLGPLGLVPAPTKWRIRFGEPLRFDGYGPEAADDEILVGKLAERVRTTIQGMLDEALEQRQSVWFG
jgi:1-acyl-sn-glycerol-3-phosphate acyltransferase